MNNTTLPTNPAIEHSENTITVPTNPAVERSGNTITIPTNTTQDSRIDYNITELKTALDLTNPNYIMPGVQSDEKRVLDIGCGIGQTLIAEQLADSHELFGIDIHEPSIAFGKEHFPNINLRVARAEQLPFEDDYFDLVIARVSLPYTDIEKTLSEITRTLKPGGRLWCTLHPSSKTRKDWLQSVRKGLYKDVVFRLYAMLNGVYFHLTGKSRPFPFTSRHESFQTKRGVLLAMNRAGFSDVHVTVDRHFLCVCKNG